MERKTFQKIVYWAPKIAALLLALFISLFAFDVFDAGYTFQETILALIIHLIPTYLILGALAVGWKWNVVGSVCFFLLGIAYILVAWGDSFIAYLLVAGPAFIIAILFMAEHYLINDQNF